jgi:hypothetical protein
VSESKLRKSIAGMFVPVGAAFQPRWSRLKASPTRTALGNAYAGAKHLTQLFKKASQI